MSTAWEQLEGAALSLVRSGPIKERLTDAYRNHLALVNPAELPERLRAEFRACHDALTREPPLRGEDAVRATVRKMSNQEADEVACSVVRLFVELVFESAQGAQAPVPAVEAVPAVAADKRVNGAGARAKGLRTVPPVISLYSGEA
jgi:hypothetical protein